MVNKHNDIIFWFRWIVANSLAEFIGLGIIATIAYVLVTLLGEPTGLKAMVFAIGFVVLGAFEGLVVGSAQSWVLKKRIAELQGWVAATVIGAVVAWLLGMLPSTIMSVGDSTTGDQPPNISENVQLLLAIALGLATGPVLAFFQWLRLRHYLSRNSIWWLAANALAWAVGMPAIFMGADLAARASTPIMAIATVGLSLLIAGALVGAVHGGILIWLLKQDKSEKSNT
jgi:hypothetical protein